VMSGQPQRPAWQVFPFSQALPQTPQFLVSVRSSTQLPLQQVCPPVQAGLLPHMQMLFLQTSGETQAGPLPHRQVPPWQFSPDEQPKPHDPQFLGLVEVSTQLPLQQTFPPEQAFPVPHMHLPLVQVSPAAQAACLPHMQMLFLQISPGAHMFPQLPQLLGSLLVSAH
jgi:hypothetical protein